MLADIAQIVDRADCVLVSPGVTREETERLGFRYAATAQEALDMAFERQGREAEVAVLRHGGHIFLSSKSETARDGESGEAARWADRQKGGTVKGRDRRLGPRSRWERRCIRFFVHYTIALTSSSLVFDALGFFLEKASLTSAGLWTLVGSALMTLRHLGTGLTSATRAPVEEGEARSFLRAHMALGLIFYGLLVALALWRVSLWQDGRGVSWLYLAALAVVSFVMTVQGYLGGELVYRYGVEVEQSHRELPVRRDADARAFARRRANVVRARDFGRTRGGFVSGTTFIGLQPFQWTGLLTAAMTLLLMGDALAGHYRSGFVFARAVCAFRQWRAAHRAASWRRASRRARRGPTRLCAPPVGSSWRRASSASVFITTTGLRGSRAVTVGFCIT